MTRLFLILAILPLVSGCATYSVSQTALCSGTKQSRDQHAEALLADGGPRSVATGATVLGQIAAGCAESNALDQ
jgi:hypothetical protein